MHNIRSVIVNYLNKVHNADPKLMSKFLDGYKLTNLTDENPIICDEEYRSSCLGLINGFLKELEIPVIYSVYNDNLKFIRFE